MNWFAKKVEIKVTEPDYIPCEKCKHLILKKDAYKARYDSYLPHYGGRHDDLYFCNGCAPMWKIKEKDYQITLDGKYPQTRYYRDHVECDENGKIINEKKA